MASPSGFEEALEVLARAWTAAKAVNELAPDKLVFSEPPNFDSLPYSSPPILFPQVGPAQLDTNSVDNRLFLDAQLALLQAVTLVSSHPDQALRSQEPLLMRTLERMDALKRRHWQEQLENALQNKAYPTCASIHLRTLENVTNFHSAHLLKHPLANKTPSWVVNSFIPLFRPFFFRAFLAAGGTPGYCMGGGMGGVGVRSAGATSCSRVES